MAALAETHYIGIAPYHNGGPNQLNGRNPSECLANLRLRPADSRAGFRSRPRDARRDRLRDSKKPATKVSLLYEIVPAWDLKSTRRRSTPGVRNGYETPATPCGAGWGRRFKRDSQRAARNSISAAGLWLRSPDRQRRKTSRRAPPRFAIWDRNCASPICAYSALPSTSA